MLVVSLNIQLNFLQGNRSEDYNVNPAAAQADAQALLRAGIVIFLVSFVLFE